MIKDIALRITEHFIDNFAGTCPIVYDNQPPVDMSDEPVWARFAVRFGDQRIVSMGNAKGTDQNVRVILQIFVQDGLGSNPAYELAESFTDIFRYLRISEPTFQIAGGTGEITNMRDGNLFQMNVSIPLRASFVVT